MTDDTPETENADRKTGVKKPWQFQPGQSGNPAGKPKGAKHRATQAMQELLEGEHERLTRKAVDLALEGDTTALRLCLDRLCPPYKSAAAPVNIALPESASLTATARAFITAAANGEIPADLASSLVSAVASVVKIEEVENLRTRLEALERATTTPKEK